MLLSTCRARLPALLLSTHPVAALHQSYSTNPTPPDSNSSEAAWDEEAYLQDFEGSQDEEQQGEGPVDRQQLLRQVLRRTHAAEVCVGPVTWRTQEWVLTTSTLC
jgi:hypothetical protein